MAGWALGSMPTSAWMRMPVACIQAEGSTVYSDSTPEWHVPAMDPSGQAAGARIPAGFPFIYAPDTTQDIHTECQARVGRSAVTHGAPHGCVQPSRYQ
mmetsp:Transcript_8843/g.18901  ORF Transcript_8843/g.18901 Transcript_8843/m.18901 type:complete len:98 (+) Transcript_8843:486-779(+)